MHRSIRVCLAMAATALLFVAGGVRPASAQDAPAWAQVLPRDAMALVTWAAVTDATGYTVSRRVVGEEIDKAVKVTANPIKETSLTDSNLTNGTTYIYSVTATTAAGTSEAIEAVGTPHAAIVLAGKNFQFYDIETTDPGGVKIDGNVLTIRASGADIWDGEDGQTFLATPVTGDFTMTMKLLEVPKIENDESSTFGKVGLQAKAGLFPDSPYALVFASVERSPEYMFEGRRTQGGGEGNWSGGITDFEAATFPAVFRLTRRGNVFSGEVSVDDGKTFTKTFADQTMASATPEMYVGIAATAHSAGLYVNGRIDVPSIQLTTP